MRTETQIRIANFMVTVVEHVESGKLSRCMLVARALAAVIAFEMNQTLPPTVCLCLPRKNLTGDIHVGPQTMTKGIWE